MKNHETTLKTDLFEKAIIFRHSLGAQLTSLIRSPHVFMILVLLQEQCILSCSAKNVWEATVFFTNDRKFLILSLVLSWQKGKTNTLHSFLPMLAISGSISREKKVSYFPAFNFACWELTAKSGPRARSCK